MAARVLIIDTSVLCCLLNVPGKETAGPVSDRWDNGRVVKFVEEEIEKGSTFVLPLASIIETGNHVAQAPGDRHPVAVDLGKLILSAAEAKSPWAAFTDQSELWAPDRLKTLSEEWPPLAAAKLSIGDATIKAVAEFYSKAGFEVEIVTGDEGLKSYEPPKPKMIPRRRA